mmetsp:Transcript_37093/g.118934  ORF Transcript_37093/g.118934 Transcript_37093/m.118934 type:complete len:301 (-) Transcript_37093:987-1889(-)
MFLRYGRRSLVTYVLLEVFFRTYEVPARWKKLLNDKDEAKHFKMKVAAIVHALFAGLGGLVSVVTEFKSETWAVLRLQPANYFILANDDRGASSAEFLTSVTVGFFFWELAHYFDWAPSSRSDKATMVIHHVISCVLWPLSCRLKIAYFFLVHFEVTELSSPFLQMRWFARKARKGELLCSGLFALAFFLVRTTFVLPMLFAAFKARPWDAALYPHLNFLVRLLSTLSLPLPFLLNLLWSAQIILMIKKTAKRCLSLQTTKAKTTKKNPGPEPGEITTTTTTSEKEINDDDNHKKLRYRR